MQAWVHDSWSLLHGGRTPHEAREKIAEQEFSERMVLLERLVILLQFFWQQCAMAAFWQVQDSLRSVQRDVSALMQFGDPLVPTAVYASAEGQMVKDLLSGAAPRLSACHAELSAEGHTHTNPRGM